MGSHPQLNYNVKVVNVFHIHKLFRNYFSKIFNLFIKKKDMMESTLSTTEARPVTQLQCKTTKYNRDIQIKL